MTDGSPILLSFDCETHLIKPGDAAPRPVLLGFDCQPPVKLDDWCEPVCFETGEAWLIHNRSSARDAVLDWLVHECAPYGQNVAFDLGVVCRVRPDLVGAVFDMFDQQRVADLGVRQKLRDIAKGEHRGKRGRNGQWVPHEYNLAAMSSRHGYPVKLDKDTWRLRYSEFDEVKPADIPQGAKDYAGHDVLSGRWVYNGQTQYEARILADQYRQAAYAWALHLVAVHGIITDRRMVYRFEAMVQRELRQDRQMLVDQGFVYKHTKGAKAGTWSRQMKLFKTEYLPEMWARLGVTRPPRTKGGALAMHEDAAKISGDEVFLAFQRFGAATTLLARVRELYAGCDGKPIHTRFDTLLATGRTSSSAPNIQNRRRKPGDRECFVPRPGMLFVDADYDGLELRTIGQSMVHLGIHSRMVQRLNAGADPHLEVAAEILNIPYEDAHKIRERMLKKIDAPVEPGTLVRCGLSLGSVDPVMRSVGMSPGHADPLFRDWTCDHEWKPRIETLLAWLAFWVDEVRQTGKIANFGFNAGAGIPRFVNEARAKYGIHMTKDEATLLKAHWLATWPEYGEYFDWVSATTKAAGDHATFVHFGSDRIRAGLNYTELANTPSQGLGSDATKHALYELARACYVPGVSKLLYGCRIPNFIHDQYLVEIPDDPWAHDRAMEVGRIMTETANQWLPDVPTTATPMLCRRWSKLAKPIYDNNGRLVPWEWSEA